MSENYAENIVGEIIRGIIILVGTYVIAKAMQKMMIRSMIKTTIARKQSQI